MAVMFRMSFRFLYIGATHHGTVDGEILTSAVGQKFPASMTTTREGRSSRSRRVPAGPRGACSQELRTRPRGAVSTRPIPVTHVRQRSSSP
jgi:hypothetical protein